MRPRGCPTRFAGLALALACTATAAVADIYKIVGPDGRVTYSDRPPVGAEAARSAVVSHTGPSAPRRPVPETPDAGANAARGQAAAPAPGSSSASKGRAAPPPLAAPLSQALVAVLAGEDRVESMFDTCTRTQPGTYERFADHLRTWRHRNVQLIAQADRVLEIGVSAPGRSALQAAARTRVDAELAPLVRGPHARLVQWCDQGADRLLDGTLDLIGRPGIADPISRWAAP